MSRGGIHRRLVALVAAYAFALHGLLIAFAPASPVLGFDAPLCAAAVSHGGDAGKNGPPPVPDCTLCPLMCSSAAGPLPSFDAKLVPPVGSGEVLPAPSHAAPVVRPAAQAGLARAPPA